MTAFKCPKCGKVAMTYEPSSYFKCRECGYQSEYRGSEMEAIWTDYIIANDITCPICETNHFEPCFVFRDDDWYCNNCNKWFKEASRKKVITSVTVDKKLKG